MLYYLPTVRAANRAMAQSNKTGEWKDRMISLTREDWSEIYYALETKSLALRQGKYGPEDEPGQDAEWIDHIEAVRGKIGPDGVKAALKGVGRSK